VFRGPAFDPALLFHMSFSSTSANLLEWYRNQLPDRPGFEALAALAAEEADDDSIVIEPLVEGEPIDRCFRHVRPEHRPGQVVRAIMQRVARSLAEQVRALCPDRLPEQISSAGGGARSGLWEQIKANTLGVRFVVTDCAEPTSLGAAMLAARALRWEPSGQLPQSWVRPGAVFEPAQRGNGASARCL
jgi:xylulokinase